MGTGRQYDEGFKMQQESLKYQRNVLFIALMMFVSHTVSMGANAVGLIRGKA